MQGFDGEIQDKIIVCLSWCAQESSGTRHLIDHSSALTFSISVRQRVFFILCQSIRHPATMPIDPLGTAIGIAGLLATFKGAVDGYLLLESFFAKDNGLRDLATRFHVERKELEEWRHQFNLQDEDPQACLLHYETDENKHLMFETLDRINKSLIDAQNLLDNHTGNDGLKPKKSSKFWRSRGEKDGPKNRIRWAITNKAKFENCLTAIKAHLENLVRFSKRIQILQLPNWTQVLEWLTQIDENSYHRKARQLRQKGTGRWLLERTEFTQWLAGLAKDLLWVNATRK